METVEMDGIVYEGFIREVDGRTELCVQYINNVSVIVADVVGDDDYDGIIPVVVVDNGQWRPL